MKKFIFYNIVIALSIFLTVSWNINAQDISFHHHIHNFSVNYQNATKNNYALVNRHALAMGYKFMTLGKPLDEKFNDLGVIKLHNSKVSPFRLDLINKKIRYMEYYELPDGQSTLRKDRESGQWYSIDSNDLALLRIFACMKCESQDLTIEDLSEERVESFFWTTWPTEGEISLLANWQSKYVVNTLSSNTIASYFAGNYSALFFDSFGGAKGPECVNKNIDGQGQYDTWGDGRIEFVKRVTEAVHSSNGTVESQKKYVFANIWDPLMPNNEILLELYKSGELRLDHYYLESGLNIAANGTCLDSMVPAFVGKTGCLPANIVSVDVLYGWYSAISDNYQESMGKYFEQHLYAAGIAATQGSWFGWYGEDNLDNFFEENSQLMQVYTNDLQLLRAIPNWDNLMGISIGKRTFNKENNSYNSPNSFFSPEVIYSRMPYTGELYVVFVTMDGVLRLEKNEKIIDARFSNFIFEKTDQSAIPCLEMNDDYVVKLSCKEALKKGIRILLSNESYNLDPIEPPAGLKQLK